MAISSIIANQANAVPSVQNAPSTSKAKVVNRDVQGAGGKINTDTVTISREAQKAIAQAVNTAPPVQTTQKTPEANANKNGQDTGGMKKSNTAAVSQLAQKGAVAAANAALTAAKAQFATAEQNAAAAQAAAAEQSNNSSLAIAAAQAANEETGGRCSPRCRCSPSCRCGLYF